MRFQVLLRLVRIHLGQLGDVGLHLRRNRHRGAAVDLGQLGVHGVLVHVRDVEHRLHGEQVQLVDGRDLVLGQPQRAGAMALVQAREHLLRRLQLRRAGLVALGLLLQARDGLLNRGDVGQDELGLDGVHVRRAGPPCRPRGSRPGRRRSAPPRQMASVSRMFARNWLPRPSPWLAPATKPAMSTNSTVAGTIFAGWSISASACRRVVGHRHDAHVGLDGGERVVGGQTALVGQRREQRGLADVRQPHDTELREP